MWLCVCMVNVTMYPFIIISVCARVRVGERTADWENSIFGAWIQSYASKNDTQLDAFTEYSWISQ